jgi:small subunit ribosomal protein S1
MTENKKKSTNDDVVEPNESQANMANEQDSQQSEVTNEAIEEAIEANNEPELVSVESEAVETMAVKTVKAEHKSVTAEEFDWEAFESEELHNSPKHKHYEELYDETLSTVAVDELVIGSVIQMTSREVVINIGYKSEGVVSLNEFRYNPNLKVGDSVEVYVESQEDKKGQLLLSHKKARSINSWNRVNASLEKDEIITGYIKCRTKGGMIVDVFGIEAFLPGSQIDVKPIRDYDVFVGKTM